MKASLRKLSERRPSYSIQIRIIKLVQWSTFSKRVTSRYINKAYEVLTNEKSRFMYDLHLKNPQESEYYHQYRYYSSKYIQNPQVSPILVVVVFLLLVSTLQYVMRRQMYTRAIYQISESHDFKSKVNELCKGDKKKREKVKEELL